MQELSMKEQSLPPILFQTFFVSRERSSSPQIEEIIGFCKKLGEAKLLEEGKGSVSIGYGNRMLITGEDALLSSLSSDDIVEVVDVDPIKNIVLAAGKRAPSKQTPVHWLIQRARHDVHVVVFLPNKKITEYNISDLPVTECMAPSGTIDLAKEVLKALRNGKTIIVKDTGLLLVGLTLHEIETTTNDFKKRIVK